MSNEKKSGNWFARHKVLTIIGAIIVLIGVISVFTEDETPNVDKTSSSEGDSSKSEDLTPYREIAMLNQEDVRGYAHYEYTGSDKPSQKDVKKYMSEIEEKGCTYQVCNYFLWSSKDAYENGKDDVNQVADKFAKEHQENLIGYINSGFAFFYYGSSSDKENTFTIYDRDTRKYLEMSSEG